MFLSSLANILGVGSRPHYYLITQDTPSINEGSIVNFTVNASGVANTTLFWTINFNGSSAAADFSATSGSFAFTNNTGTFSVITIADQLTEGSETFYIEVRTVSTAGTIVADTKSSPTTINDTSLTPAAAFVTPVTSVNEGVTQNYTVNTTNYPTGTLYWNIINVTTSAADFSATTGSFAISGSTGTFSITTIADATTEGNESFNLEVRINSASGTLLATVSGITLVDTSQTPVATFTTLPTPITESGTANTYAVSVTNFSSGTLYWTILHGTTVAADFSAVSGSFTITSGAGSFTITAVADTTTEGNETFTIQIRTGSITGTVIGTSSTITISDTSVTPNGEITQTGTGTIAWVCPSNVNSVSVVCIGGGGGGVGFNSNTINQGGAGGGGALYYRNNIPVVPGNTYNLNIVLTNTGLTGGIPYFGAQGAASNGGTGSPAIFGSPTNVMSSALCGAPGGLGGRGQANDTTPYTGVLQGGYGGADPANTNSAFGVGTVGVGGRGGFGGGLWASGGGGAGGYANTGGAGARTAGGTNTAGTGTGGSGTGGSVNTTGTGVTGTNGGGASLLGVTPGGGTLYGGGGAAGRGVSGLQGMNGAIRVVWPGQTRAFPSTGV